MERYEYIIASVDCGTLRWKSKLEGANKAGSMTHNECVEDWSNRDIINVTMRMLDVPEDQRELIKVIKVEYA
jgi:hypothetical protein